MAKRSDKSGLALFRAHPAGAGLLVVATTVLGWLGCDSLSHVADRTADLMNQAPPGGAAVANNSPWGNVPAQNSSFAPNAPYPYPSNYGQPYGTTNPNAASNPYATGTANPNAIPATNASTTNFGQAEPHISIGSFNIQVFGSSKFSDRNLMNYLVDIARKFDILAIQELRSTDETIIPQFVQMINQGGLQYGWVVGPREGRTSSKEQYVYIYNEQKIERVDQGTVLRHPRQMLHRDPLAVTFRCRTPDPRSGFTFTLINIHTDPDMVPSEMAALAEIMAMARQSFSYEDDLILVGDFNASPLQFGALAQVPNLWAAIPPEMKTNTARTQCYDNIVFDRLATTEYQNRYGVFDLATFYGLTTEQTQLISDHQPVWALFSAFERPPSGVASQPPGFR